MRHRGAVEEARQLDQAPLELRLGLPVSPFLGGEDGGRAARAQQRVVDVGRGDQLASGKARVQFAQVGPLQGGKAAAAGGGGAPVAVTQPGT